MENNHGASLMMYYNYFNQNLPCCFKKLFLFFNVAAVFQNLHNYKNQLIFKMNEVLTFIFNLIKYKTSKSKKLLNFCTF